MTSFAATWALVGVLHQPSVEVDIDALALPHAQAEQLHGEVMTRLVEAGHPVGSPAVVTLRLVGAGDHVHVEAQHGEHVVSRQARGEGALLRLAVVHAALAVLTELATSDDSLDAQIDAEPDRTVVIEATDPESIVPVVARLVDAGYVVAADETTASWRLCVQPTDAERPWVSATVQEQPCPPASASDPVEALAVARASVDAPDPDPVSVPATSADVPASAKVRTQTTTASPARVSSPQARPWSAAIGIGAGAQGRLSVPEAFVLAHGDARHRRGALLTTRISVAPTVSSTARTADTTITVGGGWGFSPAPRLRLELAAGLGIAVHAYSVERDRGVRVDFTTEAPLSILGRLSPRVELGAQVIGGWTTRGRRHRVADDIVWSRDAWRVGGGLVLRMLLSQETRRGVDG